jgi:WD40 repeat protein
MIPAARDAIGTTRAESVVVDAPAGDPASEVGPRFKAFISYRHVQPDQDYAKRLQSDLEGYRVPEPMVRAHRMPKRLGRVFRDEDELAASPNLTATIEEALRASDYLIVVCSPRAAASRWVDAEVEFFRKLGRADRILTLLIEGEPSDAFPPGLRDIRPGPRAADEISLGESPEPLAADVRPVRGGSKGWRRRIAKLRIAAALLGCRFDDLRQREQERRQRRTAVAAGVVAVIAVGFAVLAGFAFWQKNEAQAQRDAALSRGLASRAETLVDQHGTLLETAALLAVEGAKMTPSAETDRSLRKMLAALPRRIAETAGLVKVKSEDIAPSLVADRALRKVLALLPKRIAEMNCSVGGDVQKAALSPEGSYLATLAGDNTVRVWETRTGRLLDQFGVEAVDKLVFSPLLERLVVLASGRAAMRDFASGRLMSLPREDLRDVAYTPDGEFLASVGADRTTRLWDGVTLEQIAQMANSQDMRFVTASPHGEEVIAWDTDIADIFRSPGQPAEQMQLIGKRAEFLYSPNGTYLARVLPSDYSVLLLDRTSRQSLLFENRHWNLAFSGNGLTMALASPEWDASSYDLASCNINGVYWETSGIGARQRPLTGRGSCRRLTSVHHDNSVVKVSLSRDGGYMGTTSSDQTARVWDTFRGREVLRLLESSEGKINEMAFSADGQRVTGWGPRICRTWESHAHQQVVALDHPDAVSDVAFSADGQRAATVGQDGWALDGTVRIWAAPEWNEIRSIPVPRPHPPVPFKVALSSDGSRLLVNREYELDLEKQAQKRPLPTASKEGSSATSRDWRFVVVTKDQRIIVFKDGIEVASHAFESGPVATLAMAADGCCVAIAVAGEGVRIWRWADDTNIATFPLPEKISMLSFDGSGSQVAAIIGDSRSTVIVLQVENARHRTLVHEGKVASAAFDPSGKFVVTASEDRTVRVWDLAAGSPVAQLVHNADATAAIFSPDGRYVLSAGGRSDRTARLWFWRPDDLISEACARLHRKSLTEDEWRQYVGTEGRRTTCPPDQR